MSIYPEDYRDDCAAVEFDEFDDDRADEFEGMSVVTVDADLVGLELDLAEDTGPVVRDSNGWTADDWLAAHEPAAEPEPVWEPVPLLPRKMAMGDVETITLEGPSGEVVTIDTETATRLLVERANKVKAREDRRNRVEFFGGALPARPRPGYSADGGGAHTSGYSTPAALVGVDGFSVEALPASAPWRVNHERAARRFMGKLVFDGVRGSVTEPGDLYARKAECWQYDGARLVKIAGRQHSPARAAWMLFKGTPDPDLRVSRTCGGAGACVNPWHHAEAPRQASLARAAVAVAVAA